MQEIPYDDEENGKTKSGRKNSKSSSGSLDKEGYVHLVYLEEEEEYTELTLPRNDWLAQQAREKRRCRVICMSISLAVMMVIIAAAIVGWYFTKVRKI
jgi:cytoskeletal protein RodZ